MPRLKCRNALNDDPADQTALRHLVRALRENRLEGEIPGLLKQLAVLRHEANNKKREENRIRLVDAVQNLNNSAHQLLI